MRIRVYTDLRTANSSFARRIHIERVTRVVARQIQCRGTGNTTYTDKRISGIMRVRNINVDILISILVILSVQELYDGQLRDHRIN